MFASDGKNISVDKKPSEYTPVITTTTAITTVQVQEEQQSRDMTYVLNTNTKKIHYESCSSVDKIKEKNKAYTDNYDGTIAQGDINHVEDATHRIIINLIYETAPIGFLCLSVLYFALITTS